MYFIFRNPNDIETFGAKIRIFLKPLTLINYISMILKAISSVFVNNICYAEAEMINRRGKKTVKIYQYTVNLITIITITGQRCKRICYR